MRGFALLSLALLASAGAAAAHTTIVETEAPLGKAFKVVLAVPHGCAGKATTQLDVELPEGFVAAQPMPKPGWTLAITEKPYAQAYEMHGKPLAAGAVAVRWSGGRLENAWYDEFVLRGTFLKLEPGTAVPFKVVQTCEDGSTAPWTEVAAPGRDPHALDDPAPTVTIRAAEAGAGHHHGAPSPAAAAGTAKAGSLVIDSGFARAMLPGAKVGGGYLSIRNEGSKADRLLSVRSPASGSTEVHEMSMKGDVMSMAKVEGGLPIPAGETVTLAPGGLHLMFQGVSAPFEAGSSVPVTLTFEKAGEVTLDLPVLAPNAKDAAGAEGHKHH